MRRRLARPGLSYVDANSGRLITESAEVLDMKAQIRARWPDLDISFDTYDRLYCVTQRCEDHVERLVMTRPYCDARLIADIAKCDPTNPNYVDPLEAVDKHNESIEREQERQLEEISGDFGERLIHALKKDGFYDHEDISGVKRKPQSLRDRAIR